MSEHYTCEVKNVKVPAMLWKWWNQIVSIALTHRKEPLIMWYPSNELNVLGVPKYLPPLHIITEARHEELLRKEKFYDKIEGGLS